MVRYEVEYTRPDGSTGLVLAIQSERAARETVAYYETDAATPGYRARISALEVDCQACGMEGGRWKGRTPLAVKRMGFRSSAYWVECAECAGRGSIRCEQS